MSASSASSSFRGVTFESVVELVRTLQSSSLTTRQHIKRIVAQKVQGFNEALEFCRRLRIVDEKGDVLRVASSVPAAKSEDFVSCVLERIAEGRNQYRTDMFRYLRRFRLSGGEATYVAPSVRSSEEQACRNFLMEMRLVTYRPDSREHVVSEHYLWLYGAARDSASQMSRDALQRALSARGDLGDAAELAVVKLEKKRVGTGLAVEVKHVAASNVSAGYDIRSVTVQSAQVLPRFIEVKAVSASSFEFFWSRREMVMAEMLRDHYYLYLLPVGRNGFDESQLRIVADPHAAVCGRDSEWLVEADGYRCTLSGEGKRVRR